MRWGDLQRMEWVCECCGLTDRETVRQWFLRVVRMVLVRP